MRSLRGASLALLALAGAAAAAPQAPAGAEFRVNTFTSNHQYPDAAAMAPDGRFVVVWSSFTQDGGQWGVYAQRYAPDGTAAGAEFRVNTTTSGLEYARDVAMDADGSFVVVWEASGGDGEGFGIMGRRYDPLGAPRGGEFQVNTFVTGDQYWADLALSPGGGFVVVWASVGQDGSGYGIFGQRFHASGARAGAEFRVNALTLGDQYEPAVASSADGRFVVAWTSSDRDGSGTGIGARRFDADGTAMGGEFTVNAYTTGNQRLPTLAVAADGRFTVAWTDFMAHDGAAAGVFARAFDASGAAQGAELQVNTYTTGLQSRPAVGADASGNFFVSWHSGHDGSLNGVYARRFTAAGAPRGSELRVNTFIIGFQDHPLIAVDPVGNAVVAWRSASQDGSGFGGYAQRYGGLLPSALAVDAPPDDVLEPGEAVELRPSWRNVNGAAQTFAGTLLGFTGPAGADYTITDADADYGTVAHGSSRACADCYGIAVSDPPLRPALHWDTEAAEAISPDVLGQHKLWKVHVGGSFTDVPAGHPFYRFVETLLHHGVTGGCTAEQYCPGAATSREQMAVFVLVAKETAGFAPPACAAPNLFADVPETSAFCRWIEELAGRGVVGGCAANPPRYCPTDPVTREQMAIFVLRTLEPTLEPPACAPPNRFTDVPESSVFCRWIEELAARGVVGGCAADPPRYCPTDPVTREQMGVFLSLTFGLTLYGPT